MPARPSLHRDRALQLALLAGLFACTASTAACNRNGQAQTGAAPQGPPPAPVQLESVQPRDVADTSEYVATLRSLGSTTIKPEVDGFVTRLFVKSGDRVQRGSPLLQIDPRAQQATVSSQQAAIEARQADVRYARQQLERLRDLYKQQVVSKQEVDQAETALNTAEADVSSLNARLREQDVRLQFHHVISPTSGVVGDIPVRLGDRVTSDTMITTVDNNDALELYVAVPIDRAPALRLGLPVDVVDGSGSVVATAPISFVSPRAEEGTQSVLAKAIIRGKADTLRSSQYVRARIRWRSTSGLVVPVLAVLRVNSQSFVFVAEPGQGGALVARQRPIRVGPITGNDYTVLDGLKPGERIVVSGVQRLIDGVPIQPTAQGQAGQGQKPASS